MSTGTPAPTPLQPSDIQSNAFFQQQTPQMQRMLMREVYNNAVRPTFAGKGSSPAALKALSDWGIASPGVQPGAMDALKGAGSSAWTALNQGTLGRLTNAAIGRTPDSDPMVPSFGDAARLVDSGQNSSLGDVMFPIESLAAGRQGADRSTLAGLAGGAGAVAGTLPDQLTFGAAGKLGGMAARGLGAGRLTSAVVGNVGASGAMAAAPDIAEGKPWQTTAQDALMAVPFGLLPDAPAIEQAGREAIHNGLTGLAAHMAKPYEFVNPAPIIPDHTTTGLVPVGQVVPPAARRTIPMSDIDAQMQANAARYQQQGGNVNGAYMMPPSPDAPGVSSLGRPADLSPHDQNVIANSLPAPDLSGRVGEAPAFGPRVEQPTPSSYQPSPGPRAPEPLPNHIQNAIANAPGALDFTARNDGFGPRADYTPSSAYEPYRAPEPPAPSPPLPGHLQGALNNAPGDFDFSTHSEGFGPRGEYQPGSDYQGAPRPQAPTGPEPIPAHVQNAIDNALPAHELAHTLPAAGAHEQHPLLSLADRLEQNGQRTLNATRGRLYSGVDPEVLSGHAQVLAAKLIRGGVKFADWAKEMVAQHGPTITQHLRPIWDQATNMARNAATMHADGAASPLDLGTPHTIQPQLDALQPKLARLQKVLDRAKADGNAQGIADTSKRLQALRQQENELHTNLAASQAKAEQVTGQMQADPPKLDTAYQGPKMAGSINMDRIGTSSGAKTLFQEVAKQYGPQIDYARRGVQTHEDTIALAHEQGMTVKQFLATPRGKALNAEEITGARILLHTSGMELERAARKAAAGSPEDVLAFTHQMQLHAQLQAKVSGVMSEAGRALSAGRIVATESKARLREIQGMLDKMGGEGKARELAGIIAEEKDPAVINRLARDSQRKNFGDMLSEYWTNSILSNPGTHMAYGIGRLTTIAGKVIETTTGAIIGKALEPFGHKPELSLGEAKAQAFSVLQGAKEGTELMLKTLKTGHSAWEQTELDGSQGNAIPDWAGGQVVNLPKRLILARDALEKGIFYRMELNGLAYRQVLRSGATGADFAGRLSDLISNPTDALMKQARHDAEYQTNTGALDGEDVASRIGRGIMHAKQDQTKASTSGTLLGSARNFSKDAGRLALHLVVPFVKLPTQMVLSAVERSILAPLPGASSFWAGLEAGGASRELALAKVAIGTSIMASMVAFAKSGLITGSGPDDPARRKMMMANGWKPNSFKVGDTYVPYNKLGSIGLDIGMAADLGEWDRFADPRNPEGKAALLEKCLGGIFKNLSNESFMKGIQSFIEAVEQPKKNVQHFVQSMAQGFVPFSGLSGSVARSMDPAAQREYHTAGEAMQAKIPGLNQQLPAKLDPLGIPLPNDNQGPAQALNPFPVATDKHHALYEELARLGHAGVQAPKTLDLGDDGSGKHVKIELSPELQHSYMEAVGKVLAPHIAHLDAVAKSPAYQAGQDDDVKREVWSELFREAHGSPSHPGPALEAFLKDNAPALRAALADQRGQRALAAPATSYRQSADYAPQQPGPQAQPLLSRPGSGNQTTF